MKLTHFVLVLPALLHSALAANSWAGANNYYIYALPQADRLTILSGMQTIGMKVLRTWVTGFGAGQKDSTNVEVHDLEANGLGTYNETVLNLIDQLMVDAHSYGVKLLIGMYDQNALRGGDNYNATYGLEGFYTNASAISTFNDRITYILSTHKNALLGNRSWNELPEYIFGLEAQNEPMIFNQTLYLDNLSWICETAQQIRNNVVDPNQLIFTGGGSAAASVQPIFFDSSCAAIDVVAIHDYTDGYDSYMPGAISQAQAAGKKLIVEEWGSLVGSGRTANLNSNMQKINSYKVPFLYWELISNPDPHQGEDYEIQVNATDTDWITLSNGSLTAAALPDAPFDFSAALALNASGTVLNRSALPLVPGGTDATSQPVPRSPAI
ncbi:glycoside hydrolase family 5 protein [Mycena albidolilacea]|uniref:mannan endo-1,4-beta-mannosidase n=1 Tax=Mycena albidolilacea TaxID=1033008 RepID=A0AAD6ZGG8_9AGAR|nr:glycoside hydrolase family 5 protein [Mycena albidolilacea]